MSTHAVSQWYALVLGSFDWSTGGTDLSIVPLVTISRSAANSRSFTGLAEVWNALFALRNCTSRPDSLLTTVFPFRLPAYHAFAWVRSVLISASRGAISSPVRDATGWVLPWSSTAPPVTPSATTRSGYRWYSASGVMPRRAAWTAYMLPTRVE